MAHTHHEHEPTDATSLSAGLLVAVAAILILAIVAAAVLWSAPWADGGADTVPAAPGAGDNGGPPGDR